jgi:hypothetical protein
MFRRVIVRSVVVPAVVLAFSPAPAIAAAPWSPPVTLSGTAGYGAAVVTTPAGHTVVATASPGRALATPDPLLGMFATRTLLTTVGTDGRAGDVEQVGVSAGRLATYGSDGIVVAGTRTPATVAGARSAPVSVAFGAAGAIGPARSVPGTASHRLYALAGGPQGIFAFVTGTVSGRRTRSVWVRRGGVIRRLLTIRVSERARGAAVAVGSHGDVLVAWEDRHTIFSRHIGPSGRAAGTHALGAGVQSSIQARYDDSGRQEVAWASQRVDEGDAVTGATISYASAARDRSFSRAVVIGRDEITGTGRYVSAPGVRLVGSGSDSSVLAFTVYDGAHFRVQAADAVAGRVQAPTTLSPQSADAVLGDLAYARAGGTLVLWRSGIRGADPVGPQRVIASVRRAGTAVFGGPEAVSAETDIPAAPSAAVDPRSGAAVAAFGTLTPSVQVSVRPAA